VAVNPADATFRAGSRASHLADRPPPYVPGVDVAGQTLAVTGAAGALGGYAIQLAKARGLIVIADASSDDDDLVRTLGADQVVARGDGVTDRIRGLVPGGVPGLIDGANLAAVATAAIADGGTLSRRVADVMPARDAARAHQRFAAGGIRGRLVLDFETPLA